MKKKLSKILGVGLAVALIASLLVVAAPVSAAAETEIGGCLGTVDANDVAQWSTTQVHTETVTAMGVYSAFLDKATGGVGPTYVQFIPPAGTTFSDFQADIAGTPKWSFWHYRENVGVTNGPQFELRFEDPNSTGWLEVTAVGLQGTTGTAGWLEEILSGTTPAGYGGVGETGTSFFKWTPPLTLLSGIETAVNGEGAVASASDWVLERVRVELWEAIDQFCYIDDITIDGTTYDLEPGYRLAPHIAKNVKTADATFTVVDACGVPITDADLVFNWLVTKGEGIGDVIVVAGGGTPKGNNSITIRMVTTGDAIITVDVSRDPGGTDNVSLHAEKKWGEIVETVLTAWSATPDNVARPTGATDTEIPRSGIAVGDSVLVQELVIANFLPGPVPAPAGGAKITWWLLTNDDLDLAQTALEELLVRFASYSYVSGDLGWGHGCGQYAEWALDPTFMPEDIINAIYALYGADYTVFDKAEGTDIVDTTKTVTATDHFGDPLGEGLTNVTVKFSDVTTGLAEPVIVVLFADYPLDKNGENVVCVEYFKFSPGIPVPPSQIKTTQVRWAGEKIVLEKDWGIERSNKLVMFALEEGSIGDLIPVDTFSIVSSDSRTVFTRVATDGVARVMFKTEQQGQVDVECVLYSVDFPAGASFDEVAQVFTEGDVVENTGFLVYYLFLEEVTPWEPEPAPVDPADMAAFAVDVKGCFWTTSLPGTTREARTITFETDVGTEEYDLPAGRYVLPDDWPLMAGPNWRMLRPWMDLMADPAWDLEWDHPVGYVQVSSTYELGPYIVVNSPSLVAALPCIGPFSSLQQWSTLDMWITNAMVPADNAIDMDPFTAGIQKYALRNTVIPDDFVSLFDCPMPPAEIHFVITASVPAVVPGLSDFIKNTGPTYDQPFFASEIPANRLIPPMLMTVEGYWWDSWEFGVWSPEGAYTPNTPAGVLNREGPYWFHIDLEQTPSNRVLEAYSDNLGTCAVFIDALGGAGSVTIKAFAEYPYLPAKFPPVESDEVTQVWGAIELNPHFVAEPIAVDVGDTVTFDNLTAGGTWPYTTAEWDFDADGVIDETLTGTHAVVMADVTHAYDAPGVYSVVLTMTDSTPTTRWEERPDYITVAGEVGLPGDANGDGVVNALDITYLEMIIAGLEDETPGADANQDGVVNALDITYLEMIIAGLV